MNDTYTHRRRGWILAGLVMTMALAAMDTTIVSTAIPQIVGDLGGFSLFGWVFSVYLLAQTVTIPVYGKLADLFGRKPLLIVGTLIFLAGSALSAFSPNMPSLIVFRGLQGLGAGSIQATVNTLAGDLYNLRERGRVQGWLSSVWGVSAILGPVLGGSFAEYTSWRWIFLINLPVGAVSLTLIGRFLHEDVQRSRHRIDYSGALVILLAAGALIFGLLQGGVAWPWLSVRSVGVFAAAVALAAVAVTIERRAAEPVLPPWVWRRRTLVGFNLGALCLGLLVIGPSTFLPTYAQSVLGLGAITAGFVLATMSITWPLASALSSRLYLRVGFRDTTLLGAALALAGVMVFWLLPYRPPVWGPVLSTMILGGGLGLLSGPSVIAVQSTVRWQQRGVATGATMFSRFLGQSLGAAVYGAISNATVAHRLATAPADLRGRLPDDVDQISRTLGDGKSLGHHAEGYLRQAIDAATHHIYLALAATAALAFTILLTVVPRHFATVSDTDEPDPPRTEPADRG